MLTVVASVRGTFSSAARTLTFATPTLAVEGDTLVAVVAFGGADTITTPAGWAVLTTGGAADKFSLFGRTLDDGDPSLIVFPLVAVANEWQAELVVFRGSSPLVIRYAGNVSSFSATTALVTPGVVAQQAIDLVLSAWSCLGNPVLTLPAGFAPIDNFSTGVVSPRSLLVGYRVAGATGALTFPNAAASTSTTGTSFTHALRERAPIQPGALVDIVPGNIGLLGKDTRPTR